MPIEGSGEPRAEGASLDAPSGTLVDSYLRGLERFGARVGMRRRRPDGSWEELTREAIGARVRNLSLGLRSRGLRRGDRVALLSPTRAEWAISDYALLTAGLVSVPIHDSLPADQAAFILEATEARAVLLAGEEQLARLREVADRLPEVELVVRFDGSGPADAPWPVVSLDEIEAGGRKQEDLARDFEAFARRARPEDLVTLIYTSGTTGVPKGVMLTHDNFHANVCQCLDVLPIREEDTSLSWLPLSHVLERLAGHFVMWQAGVCVCYAESTDTVARDMAEVRPTIMTGIPRLYEKVYERVAAAAREGGFLRRAIFHWAKKVGEEAADARLAGRSPGSWLRLRHRVADGLVFRRIRERTGGRVGHFVSGGAPLDPGVARFFFAAGLPILEGYGLTETSPVLTLNPPDAPRLGTVGRPVPGTEIRIADDGEILCRGPQVMKGYYRNPEATDEAIDPDGWFRTGDIGELDEDGYLKITDRKKELIVTAGGKNIAPQPIESSIGGSRYVDQVMLIGDRRKYPVALVVPSEPALRSWARRKGVAGESLAELAEAEEVVELLEGVVERRTRQFAHYEQPKRVLVIGEPFTIEAGELTPTLKIKRRVVAARYEEAIDRLYERAEREHEREDPAAAPEGPE